MQLISDAYLFGYPLVLMDVTRQVMTEVPKPDAHNAPVNQFVHSPSSRTTRSPMWSARTPTRCTPSHGSILSRSRCC